MDRDSKQTVEERWGDEGFNAQLRDIYWMASPVVRGHLNRRATADRHLDWLTWLDNRVFRPRRQPLEFLVLGCGEGWLERALARSPAVRRIDAFDLSPEAVATADRLAREQGLPIRYGVLDLDRDRLEPAAYDVVIAHSVLHHVAELEHAYAEIAASLRPGGLLVLNEYVGPNRLQYTDRQMELINRVMVRLPERLRVSAVQREILPHRLRPDLAHLDAIDPSEAVRSEEVLSAAETWFETLLRVDAGGTLLHQLLYDLVQNYVFGDPHDDAALGLLCLLEAELIDGGALPSDFVITVSKRRADPSAAFAVPAPPRTAPSPPAPPRPWWRRLLGRSGPPRSSDRDTEARWCGLEIGRAHLHLRTTGDPACDPATWFLHRLETLWQRPTAEAHARVLGHGWIEPVARARFSVLEVGPECPGEKVDVVLSVGSLGVSLADPGRIARLASALGPGGALVALERLQPPGAPSAPTARVLAEVVDALPDHLELRRLIQTPAGDPPVQLSAVRAAVETHLAIDTLRPVGWGLLQRLLPAMATALDEGHEGDRTLLELLCMLDAELTDAGVIPTELVLLVAVRR